MATRTKTFERTTVVGVFENGDDAQRAVDELHRAGFTDKQIGVVAQGGGATEARKTIEGDETYAEEGAMTGALAGAGLGAAWAIGIAAGLLPGIGPVIAGGTLGAILASAGLGAAAGGLGGALIGMGIPEDEAEYYETEFKSGRTIVAVRAADRYDEAAAILRRHHGHTQERTGELTRASFTSNTSHSSTAAPAMSRAETTTHTQTARTPSAAACHTATGEQKVQLKEEELNVRKQPVQTGEVHVHKEVVTEHKTVEVPVKREEVVIHRHPVAGQPAAAGDIGRDQEIRIPVKEEHVRVEKTPVVKEEVTIGKRTVEETEHVGEEIRRERIKVEREGDVKVRGENEQRNP
jgi:uncharacterized protein (TIGR02271 family)